MTIGNNILSLLYKHDISQKQMAVDLGIAPSTLNGYINNRREPDYETLIKFAHYFHVSCDCLLGNTPPDVTDITPCENISKPISLTKQELKLLHSFQTLTSDQQELIMAQVHIMNRQNKQHGYTSFSTK